MSSILTRFSNYNLNFLTIFVLGFIVVYNAFFWYQSRNDLKNDVIFDISSVTLIAGAIVARILGMLNHIGDYQGLSWGILPVSEVDGVIQLFADPPWIFVKYFDNNTLFLGIVLGIVIGILFIYLNSNKAKSYLALFDRVVVSYLSSIWILLMGLFLFGAYKGVISDSAFAISYDDGVSRIPVVLLQVVVVFVLLIISIVFKQRKSKNGLFSSIFLVVYGLFELFFQFLKEDHNSELFGVMNLYQFIAIILIVAGIYLFITVTQINIFKTKEKVLPIGVRRTHKVKRIPTGNSPSSFAISFADIGTNVSDELTVKEKMNQTVKKLRRRIAK